MAEEFEKFKRFEYRQNSNLVLQREGPGPSGNEPTGEPESLVGRITIKQMGDKAQWRGPKEEREMNEKRKGKENDPQRERKQKATEKRTRLDVKRGATVLDEDVTEHFVYKPTTRQTRVQYEQLLHALQQRLGDQPEEVLKGAADEVLACVKVDNCKDSERKANCEEVLGKISNDLFTQIVQISKQITDYNQGIQEDEDAYTGGGRPGQQRGDLDDATGVAVVFDEEDEEENEDDQMYEIADEKDDDEQEGPLEEERDVQYLASRKIRDDEDDELSRERDEYDLDIAKIDSHWLQRKLNDIFGDPNMAVSTEKEILAILTTPDIQECENKLVYILKYDNFDLAKLILKNRWKVFYCTRLGQAQTSSEKSAIHEEMESTPEGQDVLEQLQTVNLRVNKEKELARNVRKEAANLAAQQQQRQRDKRLKESDSISEGYTGFGSDGVDGADDGAEEQLQPNQAIDVEALSFQQGGHYMANARVKLPESSERLEKKSYDEVIVYPYKKAKEQKEDRMAISELPEWAQASFKAAKIEKLNPIQTKVFDVAFNHFEENMLVCAPTGAGKTNVAMLCILNTLAQYRKSNGTFDHGAFKIVYVSPMKALVNEQVLSFGLRLEPYGLKVRELTGDVNLTRQQIDETDLLVTTPEKWDIITRKAGDRTYTQLVRLLIIDEVHLLHDSRGPVLESIVSRTVRQIETTQEHVRLVGLSATLPNYEDVASFMRVKPTKGLFYFGGQHRPVPLLQTYIGLKDKKAIKRFNTMNQVTFEKVYENAGKNQVLVFVHSRKETVKTARAIRDQALAEDKLADFLKEDCASREILQSEADVIKTLELKDLLPYGFAVHHAGLPRTDRKLIEDLFADRHIQVLVSTSTLAWGVNLPAHTVIIKGTQVYLPEKGAWTELSPMDVLQMMGRAGRPQYDSSGHAIVITSHSELQYYLSLNNQQLPIESQLLSSIADVCNAEIVLGTLRTRQDVAHWLAYTYLYVRAMKNPSLYGAPEREVTADKTLEQFRVNLADSTLRTLDRHNLIKYEKRTGAIQSTALGRVASHYYLRHTSIAVYNEHLKPTMSDVELLRLFSLSWEFKYILVREEEKQELVRLLERVPVPVKGSPDEASTKVNVLLQAYISHLQLEGFALMADMVYVQQSADRIMRALFEICLRRGWASLAHRALLFCKQIDKRMWAGMTPLRQFKALPEELLKKIEKKDFPWERYVDLTAAEIGELVRMPKMGKPLHRMVHAIPKVELAAYVQPLTRTCLTIELTITPDFQWDAKLHGSAEIFWVFVEDVDSEVILHYETYVLKPFTSSTVVEDTLTIVVPITNPLPPNYYIRVVSDRWLRSETTLPISFKSLILPERNPPHTELLDLQPLPVTALRFPEAEALYSSYVKAFNPIQTQVFSTLYKTNENVLICAPPSSGRIVCAEIAILRMLQHESTRRAVYVAAKEQTVKERFAEWSYRFGKVLGLQVNQLVGEMQSDLKTLEKSNLVITTPEKWDFLSRRWKNRKVLQNVRLFIVDELQLLDSDNGPTLEVCVSRMRYISAQLDAPIRVVGIANSLANAKDFGEWLGASHNGLFNFHPSVRSVPLEISIHGFDLYHRESRLMAMSRPVYQAIKHHSSTKPAIIFVTDRKQCRLTAVDLLLQMAADGQPKRFLHVSDEVMEKHVAGVREKMLAETLKFGVGYCHEGFTDSERALVERLFQSGAIQVLVVSEKLCWGLTQSAHLVVIMDTKIYTGAGVEDYSIHNILQMIGRAGRPHVDKSGFVVLLCHAAKKDAYKRFIFEPLPAESRLDQKLADHINAEIVLKTVENKQDAVDWLTWTFYYRRLSKNPNFYGLQGVTHQHLSDNLSELIETTISSLEQAQCVAVEDEVDLRPLNLGLIAAFYYVQYTTIELFNRSLSSTTKRKGILEILSASTEFEDVPMRSGEESVLRGLAQSLGVKLTEKDMVNDPHVKTLILMHAHFNRTPIAADLATDQKIILESAVRLVQGLVDVTSSNGWLRPALVAMEVSQMIVQALTSAQSPLKQLPHFTDSLVEAAAAIKIEDVFDFMNMEDDDRAKLLKPLTQSQTVDVAKACNRYPVITVEYEVDKRHAVRPGESVRCTVQLERDSADEALSSVYAPYFPKEKDEQWWLVIGLPQTNTLSAIKRLAITKQNSTVKLDFEAPEQRGKHDLILYLMSDCYLGCDQEYKFTLTVD